MQACCRYCSRFVRTFFKISTTNIDRIPTLSEIQLFIKAMNNQNEFPVPIYVFDEIKRKNHLIQIDPEAIGKTRLFQISQKHVPATDLLLVLVTAGLNISVVVYHEYPPINPQKLERHYDHYYIREEDSAFNQAFPNASYKLFDRSSTVFPNIVTHSPFGYSLVTETQRYTIQN